MSASDNKRVAKNAIALTLRMVLVTIVGLYTSRIVLEALGVDDYGIYGVIGGVVGMASFLNASMAGATSRFITFELGRDNAEQLRKVFSTSLIIHIIIALIVAVLAETVGLWFVNNKMNFPPDRMFAVNVLYQFTIISMIVSFTQVPYSAEIIAHEKMNIYAYFEIINVVLKLVIVYLLLIVNTDRLILYAALTTGVSILTAFIYRFYCIRHFKESHFKFIWDKPTIKEMLAFSGFDLYGNMCVTASTQAKPILINMFYGIVANAAASIALTVTGTISGLTSTISQAFRPHIIKQYSKNDIVESSKAALRCIQFTAIAFSVLAIPVFLFANEIIYLWLGQVPTYTVLFIRFILIYLLFNITVNVNNICIHATGNIKNISFICGTVYLIAPIVSYIWFSKHGPVYVTYVIDIIIILINISFGWIFIKKQISNFDIGPFIFGNIRLWISVIVAFFSARYLNLVISHTPTFLYDSHTGSTILHIFLITCISTGLLIVLSFLFVFNREERQFIKNYLSRIKTKIHK